MVVVPDGHEVCPNCKGNRVVSKYEEGWNSLDHDPDLAAKRTCWRCAGLGHIPKDES